MKKIQYPEDEQPPLALLEKLFSDWQQHFANNASALEIHEQTAKDMVFDGFYPYYFQQSKKILFIGWEALQMAEYEEYNYIEALYLSYKKKFIGNGRLNDHKFHRRMIRIAYGILHNIPNWSDLDKAETLIEDFAEPGGWSFAFMNISKLSNDSGESAADQKLINTSFRLSTEGRNFIEEEIAILKPDFIIAMHLKEKLQKLGKLGDWDWKAEGVKVGVKCCKLESRGHSSLLIDSWHFSARDTNDPTHYYAPIYDAVRCSETVIIEPTKGN